MRSIKRPLTHSDKRPYKLSSAWNYTPELFSLADTDPMDMNLVSRLVSRFLIILAFLIGRAPFFKNCVDYTTVRKACQGGFDHFVYFLFFSAYILHRCYIFFDPNVVQPCIQRSGNNSGLVQSVFPVTNLYGLLTKK